MELERLFEVGKEAQLLKLSTAALNALQNPAKPKYQNSEWFDDVVFIARSAASPALRAAAARALALSAEQPSADLLTLFEDMTNDVDADVRRAALEGLATLWARQGAELTHAQLFRIAHSHAFRDVRDMAQNILNPAVEESPAHWKKPVSDGEDLKSWDVSR